MWLMEYKKNAVKKSMQPLYLLPPPQTLHVYNTKMHTYIYIFFFPDQERFVEDVTNCDIVLHSVSRLFCAPDSVS